MKTKILILLMFLVTTFMFIPTSYAIAEETEGDEARESQQYENNRYELMSYSDSSWYQLGDQTTNSVAGTVKNLFWQMNLALSSVVLMIVYQLFSLDIVDLTKDAVSGIASAIAGGLISQFGQFALAIFAVGIVIKAYINQNWAAFAKLTGLVIVSLTLLFSISSERFDYIGIASTISTDLENAIMNVNPSLTNDDDLDVNPENMSETAAALENKVFDALVYQPYLLIQYGTTDETTILAEDPNRISAWLDADPRTEEGMEERDTIAEQEYRDYNNYNAYAGNGFEQAAYIFVMMLSTIVQGVVFFCIALVRIMLQFGFVLLLLLAPFAIFLSLFPSFETVVGKYTKTLFLVILFKAITMFFVLVSVSFISLGYDMTNTTDDLYYRIFIQIIMSVVIIVMYAKRHTVMNMIEGGSLSTDDMGGGAIPGQRAAAQGAKVITKRAGGVAGGLAKKGASKLGGGIKKGAVAASSGIRKGSTNLANRAKHGAAATGMGVAAATAAGTSAARKSASSFKERQLGGPDGENVYATAGKDKEDHGNQAENEAAAATEQPKKQSKFRQATAFIKNQQMGGPIGQQGNEEQNGSGSEQRKGGTSPSLQGAGSRSNRTVNQSSARNAAAVGSGSNKKSGGSSSSSGKKARKAKMVGSHQARKKGTVSAKRSAGTSGGTKQQNPSRKMSKNKQKIEKVQRNVANQSRESINQKARNKYRDVPPKEGKNLTKGELNRLANAKRSQSPTNSYDQINQQRIQDMNKQQKHDQNREPAESRREQKQSSGRLNQQGRLKRND